jgi:hypothetical protein
MLNGNLVAGASKRGLLLRVGKEGQAEALRLPGARPMEMRGRTMDGYVYVDPPALTERAQDVAPDGCEFRPDATGEGAKGETDAFEGKTEMMRFVLGVFAYVVPTFALGFVWHLILFEQYYDALAIYRPDIIIPFGFLSMLIQAIIFAWLHETSFARRAGGFWSRALVYGAVGAVLSWSFTTLAVAAKNMMASVPDYILIETAFTVVQWMMVAPLTVLAFGRTTHAGPQLGAHNAAR